MPIITEDAIWSIGETARKAAQDKGDEVASAAKLAAELAIGVITKLATGEISAEDHKIIARRATELAMERISGLVADVAEDLAYQYL